MNSDELKELRELKKTRPDKTQATGSGSTVRRTQEYPE
jgi:hypothetical protein